jgi:hypothetical protein
MDHVFKTGRWIFHNDVRSGTQSADLITSGLCLENVHGISKAFGMKLNCFLLQAFEACMIWHQVGFPSLLPITHGHSSKLN